MYVPEHQIVMVFRTHGHVVHEPFHNIIVLQPVSNHY